VAPEAQVGSAPGEAAQDATDGLDAGFGDLAGKPDGLGDRFALQLEIDTRGPRDDGGCPLTIDLFRSEGVIDTVLVYTAKR